jgi:hypothetical protein
MQCRFLPLIIDEDHGSRALALLKSELLRMDRITTKTRSGDTSILAAKVHANASSNLRPSKLQLLRSYSDGDRPLSTSALVLHPDSSGNQEKFPFDRPVSQNAIKQDRPPISPRPQNTFPRSLPEFDHEIGFRVISAVMNATVVSFCKASIRVDGFNTLSTDSILCT